MKKQKFEGVCIPAVILYMASVSIALMYTICRSEMIVCSIAMTALCSAVYMLFFCLRGKKALSLLAAVGLGAIVLAALNMADAFNFAKGGFMDFIFTASEEYDLGYAACAILMFSVFIGFVCCYFSAVVPRRGILVSPAFVPLILSARTAGGLPLWMVYFMAGSFLLCCAVIARPVSEARDDVSKPIHNLQRTLMGTGIALAAVIIAFLLPKSTVTPYGDVLNEVFSNSRGGYMNVSDRLSNFVSNSSVNRGGNNPRQDLLFVVSSADTPYIDRWSFDCYNGEKGWTTDKDYNTGYDGWESKRKLCSSADLVINLKYAAKNGGLEQYAERLEKIPDYLPETGTMVISIADDSTASVVLHPQSTLSVTTYPNEKNVYRSLRGELFFAENPEPNISYSIKYDRSPVNEYFVREFTREEIYDMINKARDEGFIGEDRAAALIEDYIFAEIFLDDEYADCEYYEQIRQLALEITEGIESDYDKALALEKWFGEAGFLYDLNFVPARTDAEYFLFTSKRGICSDYATALTLMMRSVGIPARYTEGFVLSQDSRQEDGRYYVTADKAHAYTQAYISGGWVTFDGVKYVQKAENSKALGIAVYIAAGIAAAVIILLIVFRKKISEAVFNVGMKLHKPEMRVRKAYKRINADACEISGVRHGTLTTGETACVLSNALGMKEESEYVRSVCDELFYNGTVTADTSKLADICREIRRRRRRLKK
ncbi:MAG: transglutaminase family protein [Oscillospiraceae bacterium]